VNTTRGTCLLTTGESWILKITGPGRSWKLKLKVLESPGKISMKGTHFSSGSNEKYRDHKCKYVHLNSQQLTSTFCFLLSGLNAMNIVSKCLFLYI